MGVGIGVGKAKGGYERRARKTRYQWSSAPGRWQPDRPARDNQPAAVPKCRISVFLRSH